MWLIVYFIFSIYIKYLKNNLNVNSLELNSNDSVLVPMIPSTNIFPSLTITEATLFVDNFVFSCTMHYVKKHISPHGVIKLVEYVSVEVFGHKFDFSYRHSRSCLVRFIWLTWSAGYYISPKGSEWILLSLKKKKKKNIYPMTTDDDI